MWADLDWTRIVLVRILCHDHLKINVVAIKKENSNFGHQLQADQDDSCKTYFTDPSWLALLNTGIYG